MKALVKYAAGPGNVEVREIAKPGPGPGQVCVKVMQAGICGSDIHILRSDIAIPVRPPVVMGHEFSGVIESVGEGVAAYRPGDAVVSETAYDYCGTCRYCKEGWYNLCAARKTLGYWYNGVFANYTIVPVGRLHRIPATVDFVSAAMAEPLACVIHAIDDLNRVEPGDVVLVSGPGSIGMMAAQVAKAYGATVVISGVHADADRLKTAKMLGANAAIDIETDDLSQTLMDLTHGLGPDCVLECSGAAPAINSAVRLVRKRGYYTQIGLPGKKIEFDIEAVNYKEMHFSGSMGSRKPNWDKGLALMAEGKLSLAPLVTHRFTINQWEEAFRCFQNKTGGKIFLLPEAEQ